MTDARLWPRNGPYTSTHGAIFSSGTTRELINFSTHSGDTARFNHDWSAVAAYVTALGLDGLELLLGYEAPPALPPGLVQAVHLPFWLTWLDIWRGQVAIATGSDEFIRWTYGGRTADELIAGQQQVWQHAAWLNPATWYSMSAMSSRRIPSPAPFPTRPPRYARPQPAYSTR